MGADPALRQTLTATRREAVFLCRNPTPSPFAAPGASYLGGLPKLPPKLRWPTIKVDGQQRGLTFVAQVALTDVPRVVGRELLPSTGTLFFFGELPGRGEPGRQRCAVLHTDEDVSALPVRQPPEKMLLTFPTQAAYELGWFDETSFWRRVSFRYDVSFATAWTYYRDGASTEHDQNAMSREMQDEAFGAAFGQPQVVTREGFVLAGHEGNGAMHWPEWPSAWMFAKQAINALTAVLAESIAGWRYSLAKPDTRERAETAIAYRERALDALEPWVIRASQFGDFAPMAPEDADAFRAAMGAFRNDFADALGVYKVENIIWNAADYCCKLAFSEGRPDLVPPQYEQIARERTGWRQQQTREKDGTILRSNYHQFARVQIFGHSKNRQSEQTEHPNDILLFQLDGEPGFELYPEYSGTFYFWIGRKHLQARRFEKVELEGSIGG